MKYKGTKNVYKSQNLNIDIEIWEDEDGTEDIKVKYSCLDNSYHLIETNVFEATKWIEEVLRQANVRRR